MLFNRVRLICPSHAEPIQKKQIHSPLLMAMPVLLIAATVFAAAPATLTQTVAYGYTAPGSCCLRSRWGLFA